MTRRTLWSVLGSAVLAGTLLAACSATGPPTPLPRAVVVAPVGDVQHQLNQFQAGAAHPTTARTQLGGTAGDLATLNAQLATAAGSAATAEQQVAAGTPSIWASIATMFAIGDAQDATEQLGADLFPPTPAPPTTTSTTTTTTAPSSQMSPPSGFTSSEKVLEDTFANLNNWNTFYGPGTPWNDRGDLTNGVTGGNQPGSLDQCFYTATQDVLTPAGVSLEDIPSTLESSLGYTEQCGVLTSKNPLPAGGWYVQVRAEMPDSSAGDWPAIWALPSSSAQELDGYEGGWPGSQPNEQGHSDTFASSGQIQQVWPTPGSVNLSTGYNVFGFQYVPGTGMRFYVNGTQVYSSSANLATESYYLFLQNQVATTATNGWHTTGGSGQTSSSMKIAEVQVYS